MRTLILFLFSLISGILHGQDQSVTEKCIPCEKIMSLELPDVRITEAKLITGSSAYCQVTGIIGKEIRFEILLPDVWNGIFVMGGGGGFVGTVQNSVRYLINSGYATSGTDTGHSNERPDWALNNMERQLNFGHLAVHRTAEVSKSIISAHYGYSPKYSYFSGCSRGGGQAMMEAQRYPDDFDGIIAGAPAFNWPAIASEFIQNTQALYPVRLSESVLSPEQVTILHNAILRQCDMLDGIKDSILLDPQKCRFDFSALPVCNNGQAGKDCFTPDQIAALKKVYEGVHSDNGPSYPGFTFGGENEFGGWRMWISGAPVSPGSSSYPSLHAYFGIEVFKYLIFQDPDWDYSKYDFKGYEREIRYASAYLDATSTDYSAFRNRKGKIIFWHGWNDHALSPYATIDHFNAVRAADSSADSYMKLYLLPGVLHCSGGKGPYNTDWIALIRDWVEKGIAPDKVVVTSSVRGKEVMSRPVYPYPRQAVYSGSGDPRKESSFTMK